VDDLLAGKPIKIEASTGDAASEASERIVVPVEKKTLADESWEVAETHSIAASSTALVPRASQPVGSATTVVPEPSAIALAALALVYFLLFFRRRYAL
jgi:hypothetical protein